MLKYIFVCALTCQEQEWLTITQEHPTSSSKINRQLSVFSQL